MTQNGFMKTLIILLACSTVFIGLSQVSLAQDNSIDKTDLCSVIFDTLEQGIGERDAVSSFILVGHSPCFVIKCAVEGGGSIEEIIGGALYAGVTPDVISRCALMGGADPETIARAIEDQLPLNGPTPLPNSGTPLEKPYVPVSPSGF